MNVPYTYLIGWSSLNKWYYGVRYAKKCHPSDLWNPYRTSSKLVNKFILKNGEPDVVVVRRTFNSINKARLWEQKVLIRLNVVKNEKWINSHNTIAFDSSLVPKGKDHWTKKNPDKWKEIQKRRKYKNPQNMPTGENHWTKNLVLRHNNITSA